MTISASLSVSAPTNDATEDHADLKESITVALEEAAANIAGLLQSAEVENFTIGGNVNGEPIPRQNAEETEDDA